MLPLTHGLVSFAILRSALVCLRGSRSRRRATPNIQEIDLELEVSVPCTVNSVILPQF